MSGAVILAPQASSREVGSWGMVMAIITESMIFAALLSSYFFVRANSSAWPQGDIKPPDLFRIGIFTAILLGSSIPLFFGDWAIKRGKVGMLRIMLATTFVMGLAFIINESYDFATLEFGGTENAYASLFIVITGLHGLHVIAGLLMNAGVQVKAARGWFDADHHQTVKLNGMYWHFVDAVWVFVFSSLYLTAHLR